MEAAAVVLVLAMWQCYGTLIVKYNIKSISSLGSIQIL